MFCSYQVTQNLPLKYSEVQYLLNDILFYPTLHVVMVAGQAHASEEKPTGFAEVMKIDDV